MNSRAWVPQKHQSEKCTKDPVAHLPIIGRNDLFIQRYQIVNQLGPVGIQPKVFNAPGRHHALPARSKRCPCGALYHSQGSALALHAIKFMDLVRKALGIKIICRKRALPRIMPNELERLSVSGVKKFNVSRGIGWRTAQSAAGKYRNGDIGRNARFTLPFDRHNRAYRIRPACPHGYGRDRGAITQPPSNRTAGKHFNTSQPLGTGVAPRSRAQYSTHSIQ